MKITLNKIAAILAFLIGAMAIFAGGQVLLGKDPGYYVIDWLPMYNFILGVVSFFITGILIWIDSKYAMPLAVGTFGLHAIVMLVLQSAYRTVVANDSIRAMTLRLVIWMVILALLFFQVRRSKQATV